VRALETCFPLPARHGARLAECLSCLGGGSNSKRLRPDAHQCQNPINWAGFGTSACRLLPYVFLAEERTRSSTGREIELSRAPWLGFRPGQSILAAPPTENPEGWRSTSSKFIESVTNRLRALTPGRHCTPRGKGGVVRRVGLADYTPLRLGVGRYGESVPLLLSAPEIADTKPHAGHAQSRLTARHCLSMNVFDPPVSIEPGAQASFRGWAVAAAIIARLQEVGLSGGIDVPAILGLTISDLSESELEELARQLSGPLMDTSRCFLGHHVSEWQARVRFDQSERPTGAFET
jgi:hypothetical protein